MKHLSIFLSIIIALFFFSCSSEVEYSVVGSIYGTITDADTDLPVSGASISISPTNTSITTGTDGSFNFQELEAGQYKITVTKSGYIYYSSQVDVVAGVNTIRDIIISPETEIVGFSISTSSLSFGTSYSSLTFSITNDSNLSSTSWSTDIGTTSWLTLSPSTGTTGVGESSVVIVEVDRTKVYEDSMGYIIVNAGGGSKQILVTISYEGNDSTADNDDNDTDADDNTDDNDNNESDSDDEYQSEVEDPNATPEIVDGYINIYSAAALSYIGIYDNYPLDGSYKLMNDINLSDYSYYWLAIGNSSNKFSGVFDGDGYTISGLRIDSSSGEQGLFGYVYNAQIRNVNLSDVSISAGGYNVGAIAGIGNGIIENCSVVGGSISNSENNVGGIAGNFTGTIISCYNTSSVTGEFYTGGIVGYAYSNAEIISCYNTGAIKGYQSVGGVVGYLSSSLVSCYNVGSVTRTYAYAGTVVGMTSSSASIKACYYIDQDGDSATTGIGSNYTTNYSITEESSVSSLNGRVSEMNAATVSAGYSDVKYTAGYPTTTYLPSLMGEKISMQ